MNALTRRVVAGSSLALTLLAWSASASAQSQGVVTVDRAVIWRMDGVLPATTALVGTVLDIAAQSGNWYEVVIPTSLGGRGEHGRIALSQVMLSPGAPEPPVRPLRNGDAGQGAPLPGQPSTARQGQPRSPPRVNVGGFGQVGYTTFTASQSFTAVFGESYGATFGGGLHVRFRSGLYVAGAVDRVRKTGERVFVHDGTVLPLGIPNTLTMIPLTATVGYRFPIGAVAPYIGGGIGVSFVKEETPFHEAGEVPFDRHVSYQGLGGVEFRSNRWLATAVEAQYATVRDALGTDGVSRDFAEHDLGGFTLQFKLLLGR